MAHCLSNGIGIHDGSMPKHITVSTIKYFKLKLNHLIWSGIKIYRRFFNCSHQRSYILCGHPFSLWSLFCWVRGLECGYSNAVYVKSIANPHPYEQLAVFPCCYAFLLAIRCWNCCAGLLLFGSMQEVTHSVDYERCALFPSLFPDEVRRCTW